MTCSKEHKVRCEKTATEQLLENKTNIKPEKTALKDTNIENLNFTEKQALVNLTQNNEKINPEIVSSDFVNKNKNSAEVETKQSNIYGDISHQTDLNVFIKTKNNVNSLQFDQKSSPKNIFRDSCNPINDIKNTEKSKKSEKHPSSDFSDFLNDKIEGGERNNLETGTNFKSLSFAQNNKESLEIVNNNLNINAHNFGLEDAKIPTNKFKNCTKFIKTGEKNWKEFGKFKLEILVNRINQMKQINQKEIQKLFKKYEKRKTIQETKYQIYHIKNYKPSKKEKRSIFANVVKGNDILFHMKTFCKFEEKYLHKIEEARRLNKIRNVVKKPNESTIIRIYKK